MLCLTHYPPTLHLIPFHLDQSLLFCFFFQIEFLLREKMKTGYYTIKNTFKEFDPEGKGIVSR